MPFNIFIFKVEIILYILIALGILGLAILYWIDKPRKRKKKPPKSDKPVIWYPIKK